MPVILLGAAEHSKILFKTLIGSFAGTICLGMISGADVLLDIKKSTKFRRKLRNETDISVRDDFAGDAVVGSHVIDKEFGNSFRVDGLVTRDEY